MPWITFFANSLWLMVIGLLGPSMPAIIVDLNLSYSSAGLIFTLLSAGSLLGSFVAGVISDFGRRKLLWLFSAASLALGLLLIGFTPGYVSLLITVFLMSLLGGPIGAIGQIIMLKMFPDKRGQYVSLLTMFSAAGSFLAPLIVALVYFLGGDWQFAFFTVACLVILLFTWMLFLKLPRPLEHQGARISLKTVMGDSSIILVGALIFLSVGVDIGFSYWLAEYFTSSVGSTAVFSSIAVSAYLSGVIIGRFSLSRYSTSPWRDRIIMCGLAAAVILLILIINLPSPWMKFLLCPLYGIGIGPLFPYFMSRGTGLYPGKAGAVTGILFSTMSFSGMVFPFLIGTIGSNVGIQSAYYVLFFIELLLLAGIFLMNRIVKMSPRSEAEESSGSFIENEPVR